MITFACPHCGHSIKVQSELAGRKGKCSKCGKPIVVPAEPRQLAMTVPSLQFPGEDRFPDFSEQTTSDDPLASPAFAAPSIQLEHHNSPGQLNLEGCPDCHELISIRATVCPKSKLFHRLWR
jgi:predicted Zn finger-like uncharacterized protein